MSEDMKMFLDSLKTENTKKSYEAALIRLRDYVGEDGLTAKVIRGFIKSDLVLLWSANTKRLYFTAIRRYLHFLYDTEVITTGEYFDLSKPIDDAMEEIGPGIAGLEDKILPSREEMDRVLANLEKPLPSSDKEKLVRLRDKGLFLGLMATGFRVSEVARLTIADVDWATGIVTAIVKGGKVHKTLFPPKVLEILNQYIKVRGSVYGSVPPSSFLFIRHDKRASDQQLQLSARSVENIVNAIKLAAGVRSTLTPHTLRHYAATRITKLLGFYAAKGLMGHTVTKSTEHYVHGVKKDKAHYLSQLQEVGDALCSPL